MARKREITSYELINRIQGLQTIKTIMKILDVTRLQAVYIIYRLKQEGYVTTKRASDNTRIYSISSKNRFGGTSYLDVLNENSPIKISSSEVYKIYGRKPSIEETIVYAVKTKKLRYILASLALFKKIKDWKKLYFLAKKNSRVREIGALHNLAEITFKRIKKTPKFFERFGLPKKSDKFLYVIPELKSKDYSGIEKKWKVYLPFNKEDLEDYGK